MQNGEQIVDDINQWVENQTNGRISNLIAPNAFNELTGLVLVKVRGKWKTPFQVRDTNKAEPSSEHEVNSLMACCDLSETVNGWSTR